MIYEGFDLPGQIGDGLLQHRLVGGHGGGAEIGFGPDARKLQGAELRASR
jgi:hypothetical protein